MRRYLRHSTDCPIDVKLSEVVPPGREHLCNISRGGLCFRSTVAIEPGVKIQITIPVVEPVFETGGVVTWCEPVTHGFEVGVCFAGQDPRELRIVEQICEIENFKREIWMHDGRQLNGEEAAVEWLRRHHSGWEPSS